jgi:beta-lactam-binding protein with PASTA domain
VGQRLLRLLGRLLWAGVLATGFVVSAYLAFNGFVRRGEVILPDVVGLSLDEAEARLESSGLEVSWKKERDRFDSQVEAGKVVLQIPKGGTPAKRDSTVDVALSRGRETVEVPNLVEQSMQTVLVRLKSSGLVLGRSFGIFSPGGAEGTVVMQTPAAGMRVDPSTPVDLFLRLADVGESFVMPDLIYRNYDTVRTFFERQGFRLGSVKYEPYEGAAPGAVLRQHPLPGHRLRRTDVISLVVAGGDRVGDRSPAAPDGGSTELAAAADRPAISRSAEIRR